MALCRWFAGALFGASSLGRTWPELLGGDLPVWTLATWPSGRGDPLRHLNQLSLAETWWLRLEMCGQYLGPSFQRSAPGGRESRCSVPKD